MISKKLQYSMFFALCSVNLIIPGAYMRQGEDSYDA